MASVQCERQKGVGSERWAMALRHHHDSTRRFQEKTKTVTFWAGQGKTNDILGGPAKGGPVKGSPREGRPRGKGKGGPGEGQGTVV